VLTPKVLAIRPNLHNGMQASLFPEDNKRKDIDQVQFRLKYCSATMYCRHAKEKKRKEKRKTTMNIQVFIRSHAVIFRDDVRECSTIISV
jgi:hypothetical protein